jgi:hypothetical protein
LGPANMRQVWQFCSTGLDYLCKPATFLEGTLSITMMSFRGWSTTGEFDL